MVVAPRSVHFLCTPESEPITGRARQSVERRPCPTRERGARPAATRTQAGSSGGCVRARSGAPRVSAGVPVHGVWRRVQGVVVPSGEPAGTTGSTTSTQEPARDEWLWEEGGVQLGVVATARIDKSSCPSSTPSRLPLSPPSWEAASSRCRGSPYTCTCVPCSPPSAWDLAHVCPNRATTPAATSGRDDTRARWAVCDLQRRVWQGVMERRAAVRTQAGGLRCAYSNHLLLDCLVLSMHAAGTLPALVNGGE